MPRLKINLSKLQQDKLHNITCNPRLKINLGNLQQDKLQNVTCNLLIICSIYISTHNKIKVPIHYILYFIFLNLRS